MLTVTLPPDVAEETIAKILEKQVIFSQPSISYFRHTNV